MCDAEMAKNSPYFIDMRMMSAMVRATNETAYPICDILLMIGRAFCNTKKFLLQLCLDLKKDKLSPLNPLYCSTFCVYPTTKIMKASLTRIISGGDDGGSLQLV